MPEPGGQGGHRPPQYFADQLTLCIQTGEGRLSPPITTGPPNVFHLPASLNDILKNIKSEKLKAQNNK